ncbi:MAG: phosphopantetheine-binding protein [Acidobacteriota bacterium]|nr:phosphopantetheine-binding protein [Acidobacteriota bacterium]
MSHQLSDITKLISRQLGIKKVAGEHRLREDLGAESLDIQNIVSTIEDKYHIAVDDEEIVALKSVADVHELVQAKCRPA